MGATDSTAAARMDLTAIDVEQVHFIINFLCPY